MIDRIPGQQRERLAGHRDHLAPEPVPTVEPEHLVDQLVQLLTQAVRAGPAAQGMRGQNVDAGTIAPCCGTFVSNVVHV